MKTQILLVALLLIASPLFAQETFFFSDFEFGGDTGINIFEVVELNDMDDLVGEWTGSEAEFPAGDGSSAWSPDSAGIEANPHGGSLLYIDRPIAPHTLFANLTETIQTTGAVVSFVAGTRRTGGGGAKDYDIFGLDGDGNESFRVRVATGGPERLGYVLGDEAFFDLPTVVGEDMADSIDNTGGPPFSVDDDFASVSVRLGGSGYTVDFENLNGSNAYTSDVLPFNGEAGEIAQVGFFYQGVEGVTAEQSGFFLDAISVTGFEELLQGDFNGNGELDFADFLILADNFGTNTSAGDFDFSGTVDLADFVGFKSAFNAISPAGAASVPEPSGVALVGFGLFGLFLNRRRGVVVKAK